MYLLSVRKPIKSDVSLSNPTRFQTTSAISTMFPSFFFLLSFFVQQRATYVLFRQREKTKRSIRKPRGKRTTTGCPSTPR